MRCRAAFGFAVASNLDRFMTFRGDSLINFLDDFDFDDFVGYGSFASGVFGD